MNNIDIKTTALKKIEKLSFALFLLSIPIQTRLTFFTPHTYQNKSFNEYATFFIYLSDALLLTTLFLYFVNTLTFKELFSKINRLFHNYPRLIPSFTLLITFVTWSFTTILWSEARNIAFYQSFKLIELALLFFYVRARFQWFSHIKLFFLIFITGSFESIIGVMQYYLQKSLGLRILMESVISPETPNVAKIVVDGERFIRAYGTFPHPNVFSGFLLFSLFCSFYLLYSHKNLSRVPAKVNDGKTLFKNRLNTQIVSRETILNTAVAGETFIMWLLKNDSIIQSFLAAGIIMQISAFALSYSRTAWLAAVIILLTFTALMIKTKLFISYRPELSDTENSRKQVESNKLFHPPACDLRLFHVKQFTQYAEAWILAVVRLLRRARVKQFIAPVFNKTIIVLLSVIIIPVIILISTNWKQFSNRTQDQYQESTNNRILYNNIALSMLKKDPLTGIGAKNYTIKMQNFYPSELEKWQFQPVHNIYLLIASEMGLIGLALFLAFLYSIVKSVWPMPVNQTVSRAPSIADSGKTLFINKSNAQIVSRETILNTATKGETFLINAQNGETILSATMEDETTMHNTHKSQKIVLQISLVSILVGFMFIGLFDHYFWTLQQGQLTFWLLLGMITSFKK